jgi:hypothetical protein
MPVRSKLAGIACAIVTGVFPSWGQVEPVPIPGGDVIPPLIHQFLPGPGLGFDGLNAEPNGITNFRSSVAQAYFAGLATDNAGVTYNIGADIRVYQGEYVGLNGRHARGTFVEI